MMAGECGHMCACPPTNIILNFRCPWLWLFYWLRHVEFSFLFKQENYYCYYYYFKRLLKKKRGELWWNKCKCDPPPPLSLSSGPSVWSVGEVPEAPHGLHQPAAPGAGEPVQTQQVPVQTQTLRGGHVPDADRDSGKKRQVNRWAAVSLHPITYLEFKRFKRAETPENNLPLNIIWTTEVKQ